MARWSAVLIVAHILVGGAVLWWMLRDDEPAARPPVAIAVDARPHRTWHRPDHVTPLGPGERSDLAAAIADAQATRAARAAHIDAGSDGSAGSDDNPEDLNPRMMTMAMTEMSPHLQKCWHDARATRPDGFTTIKTALDLTGDPDVGTLIDASRTHDLDGQPLPVTLDDCIRTALMNLELPPMSEGAHTHVDFTFVMFGE